MKNIFDKYCQDGQRFIRDMAMQLGRPGELDHAFRVTKAVFHTLRRRITPQESMHIVAQLPMLLKGLYVDGWEISQAQTESRTLDEFLADLRANDHVAADFADEKLAKEKIRRTFNAIRPFIEEGEIVHIMNELPAEIAEVFA